MPTEASPSGRAADGQGAEAHRVWGVTGCREPAQNGATSQARAAAPAAPLSPQSAAPTPLAWTRGPGVAQPLPCGTHGGQGAAVGLVGVRAAVCPLRARSVPAPCPPCGSGSGTHACGQGAAARRPSPSACPGCGAVRNASCRAAEQDRGP